MIFLRNAETLKKIVTKHVKVGNIIVTGQWAGCIWIGYLNSEYMHSVHNQGHGDFGIGLESTNNIEQVCAHLKGIIKNIYYIIRINNLFCFCEKQNSAEISKILILHVNGKN